MAPPLDSTPLRDAAGIAVALADVPAACIAWADGSPPYIRLRAGNLVAPKFLDTARPPDIRPDGAALVQVSDIHADARLRSHAWFAEAPHFRFLAAVGLSAPGGDTAATLYLLDTRPRRLSPAVRHALEALARQTGALLPPAPARDLDIATDAGLDPLRFGPSLLNALPLEIAVLNAAGGIVFTNLAWQDQRTGSSGVALRGDIGSNLLHTCTIAARNAPEAPKATALLRDVLDGKTAQGSFEYATSDPGRKRWFKCTIKRLSGAAPAHVLIAQEEITEVKQAARRNVALRQQFYHLFESAPDAIIMVDRSGAIRHANGRAAEMFGYDAGALTNRPIEILIDARLRRRHVQLRSNFIALGETPQAADGAMGDTRSIQQGRRSDGSLFPVETLLSRFRSGSSGAGEEGDEYVIASVRDVTQRLQAQADRVAREAAEAATSAKSAFLATMSHEIRTPLNAVLGLAEIMSQGPLSDDQATLLAGMRDSAGHLLRLIDEVLDFSKIEAGNLQIEGAPVDLGALLESTALGMADTATASAVALDLFVAPELPARVLTDAVRLRQIIYNLLGNAIKFSAGAAGRDRQVGLRAELETGGGAPALVLQVSDNGIGMAPEVIDKLFRPFTQGEGSTTRKFGGTGLGLAICKRILDRMGGTVTVRSQPGEGTTFRVRLPLDVLSAENGPAPRLPGVVCLLCESAAHDLDTLRRYLESDGATVLSPEAADGTTPDAVILGADDHAPQGLPPDLPRILIGRDGARAGPVRTRGGVFLDNRAMPRHALIRAVALALGRETPPDDAPGEREARHDAPLFTSPGDPPLILVAEDDRLNQSVILRQLEILGLRAEIAENGHEALEKWRRGHYALLLSDLHMPEMDGYGLTAAIRADEAQAGGVARLPILALTADALVGEVSRARRVGMDDYLTKPVSLARLGDALRRWLPVPQVTDMAPAGAGKIIERSDHAALLGDDPATVHALLTAYATQSRDLVARFAGAIGIPGEAAMILHRLKSSSRWVGARGFGELCEALEQAATAGDTDQLAARRAEFASLHARVLDKIAEIRRELIAPP